MLLCVQVWAYYTTLPGGSSREVRLENEYLVTALVKGGAVSYYKSANEVEIPGGRQAASSRRRQTRNSRAGDARAPVITICAHACVVPSTDIGFGF